MLMIIEKPNKRWKSGKKSSAADNNEKTKSLMEISCHSFVCGGPIRLLGKCERVWSFLSIFVLIFIYATRSYLLICAADAGGNCCLFVLLLLSGVRNTLIKTSHINMQLMRQIKYEKNIQRNDSNWKWMNEWAMLWISFGLNSYLG